MADKVIVDGGHNIGPLKTQERICVGRVKAGKCWEGKFLLHEWRGFQFCWTLQEFKAGQLVESQDFPLDKLGLTAEQASEEKWRWTIPDWPKAK